MSNQFIRIFISVFILLFITFFYQSCTDDVLKTNVVEEANSELRFSYMPNSNKDIKAKDETSEYGCFISIENEDKAWSFWSIYLHYPEKVVEKAEGKKSRFKTRLKNPLTGKVEKIANCIIPGTEQAASMAKGLLMKNVKSDNNKLKPWGQPNDEGFYCPEGYYWGNEERTWCINSEGQTSMPEMEIIAEHEEGPSGGGDNSPYSPPDDGSSEPDSSGSPCYSCDPGDDPTDSCETTDDLTLNKMTCEETLSETDLWEREIIDSQLAPCMQDELDDLKLIDKGVGKIIQDFAIDNLDPEGLGNLNWEVKDGFLADGVNGNTSQLYNTTTKTVTTTFDSRKFDQATDLSVGRVILHEAVHAYIISHFRNDGLDANKTYPDLVKDIVLQNYPDQNVAQHAEFVRNFVNGIASALEAFGKYRGHNISSQYYKDLAWGGLTHWRKRDSNGNIITDSNGNVLFEETSWFKENFPNDTDRERINNNIATEQGLINQNNQKGNDTGC